MGLFAQIEAGGWVLIISAFFLGLSTMLMQLYSVFIADRREREKIERDRRTAVEAREALSFMKQDVVDIKQNVLKVEMATNSMKDALVQAKGDVAFLEGEKAGIAIHKAEVQAVSLATTPALVTALPDGQGTDSNKGE